jgi:hypothetical protein
MEVASGVIRRDGAVGDDRNDVRRLDESDDRTGATTSHDLANSRSTS